MSLDGVSRWGSPINASLWFISLIVVLYLIYPLLTGLIKKHPHFVLISTGIISFGLAWTFNTFHIGANTAWWSPSSYLVWFSLGIFIVQREMYPQIQHSSQILKYMSDLSFPIFLMHQTLLIYTSYNIISGVAALILFSAMLLALDEKIQSFIKKIFMKRQTLPGFAQERLQSIPLPK
jgi:peptidoglycan/LPS O-acetylase OafA/YrhL